jgi:hypothetical protein
MSSPSPVSTLTTPPANAVSPAPALAAAPVTSKPSVEDRIGAVLKGIAAVAAELGPNWVHSAHGTSWLQAGELALSVIGEVL